MIQIGLMGEQYARTAEIDVSSYLAKWPDTTPQLFVIRPGEDKPYIAATTLEDNLLKWTATAYDTAVRGVGKAQILFAKKDDNDNIIILGKSPVTDLVVGPSIEGTEEAEMPDPYNTWAAVIASYATEAGQGAIQAKEYADVADEAKTAAQEAALSAEEYTIRAENAASAAELYAEAAENSATEASDSATAAHDSEINVIDLKTQTESLVSEANSAVIAAVDAKEATEEAASQTLNYKTQTEILKQGAETAAMNASSAAANAIDAKNAAEEAQHISESISENVDEAVSMAYENANAAQRQASYAEESAAAAAQSAAAASNTVSNINAKVTEASNYANEAKRYKDDAVSAKNSAVTASNSAASAQSISQANADRAATAQSASQANADRAEEAYNKFSNMSVTANTLAPGSEATADYYNGHLTLGIPEGESGVYVGTVEPENQDVNVWIDPNGDPSSVITDVQINGTSISNNGVANIPVAAQGVFGAVKIYSGFGVTTIDGALACSAAASPVIKAGGDQVKPITPFRQHESVFYGLAKAAGDTTQASSSNAVGTYTEDAKIAIKNMLGITGGGGGGVILLHEHVVDEYNIYLEYNNSTIIDESLFTSGFCMLEVEVQNPEGTDIESITYCPLISFNKSVDSNIESMVTFATNIYQGLDFIKEEDGTWKLIQYQ